MGISLPAPSWGGGASSRAAGEPKDAVARTPSREIAHAARCIAQQVKEGKLTPEQITEQTVEQNLYTAGVPDPDLIIRPSGEQRLSNFLIWQSAYSEYVFMDVLWPDFTPEHLEQAIAAFHQRQRRFGGI